MLYLNVRFQWLPQPVDATLYHSKKDECMLMRQSKRRGFTSAEKTELWERWRKGQSSDFSKLIR